MATIDVPPGTVFGRLTVIEEAPRQEPYRHRAMLCRCECGGTKVATVSALRAGDAKSCGCMRQGAAVPPGTVFGRWTVTAEAPRIWDRTSDRRVRAMLCQCECGTEKVLRLAALREGTTTSCGCAQREGVRLDVPPGTVFGRLTVIGEAGQLGAYSARAMLCQCECGTQKAIRLGALRSGNTKSCGCVFMGVAVKDLGEVKPGEVPLCGKKARGRVALVDVEDFALAMQYRWSVWEGERGKYRYGPYAVASSGVDENGQEHKVRLHVLIMGRPYIDHANGDGLDCRRSNLRPATFGENARNRRPITGTSSQFKGVAWYAPRRKWVAKIGHEGRLIHLGYFADEVEAARTYDAAARELFGEFAWPNFP